MLRRFFKENTSNQAKDPSVVFVGRSLLEYRYQGKVMSLDVEMLMGEVPWVIYTDSIKSWEFPHDGALVSPDDKSEIVANIEHELEQQGISFEWE